jgi:serine kinase of HPr protein (carbohydrate metabolism regulator)
VLPLNIHGTAIELDGCGVLIRGPSGAGKSLLALALLDRWEGRKLSATLVADDRVLVSDDGNGLHLAVPTIIAGQIELRGRGIVNRPHRDGVTLHLIVDLVPDLIRMPEQTAFTATLLGHEVSRVPVPTGRAVDLGHKVLLVAQAIASLRRP